MCCCVIVPRVVVVVIKRAQVEAGFGRSVALRVVVVLREVAQHGVVVQLVEILGIQVDVVVVVILEDANQCLFQFALELQQRKRDYLSNCAFIKLAL